jgi:hypothetical protein
MPAEVPAMADGLGPILPSDLLSDGEETDEEGHDRPHHISQDQEGRKGDHPHVSQYQEGRKEGEPREVVQIGEAYRGNVAGRAEASSVTQVGGGSSTSTSTSTPTQGPLEGVGFKSVEGPFEGPTAAGGMILREGMQDTSCPTAPLPNEPAVQATSMPGGDVDMRSQQERDDMELEARLRALLPPLSPPSNIAVIRGSLTPPSNIAVINQPLAPPSEGAVGGGGPVLSEASLSTFAEILDAPTVQVRPIEK